MNHRLAPSRAHLKLNSRRGTKSRNGFSNGEMFIVKAFVALLLFIFVVGGVNVIIYNRNNGTAMPMNTSGFDSFNIRRQKKKYNETAYLEYYPYYFNSTLDTPSYKVLGPNRFPEWINGVTPYNITEDVTIASDQAARIRREHVKAGMQHAWQGYKDYAYGQDELKPISGSSNNHFAGIGMTLIDSLDTLWLMNMKDEFYEARDWVKNSLNLNKDKYVSVFETTIRALGGLLAAYDWSHDEVFLEKANDLGERLFKAFSTNTQIAYGEVNLQTGHGKNEQWLRNEVSLSAATTLQVEFRYLAKVIGKPEFAKTVDKAFERLNRLSPKNGLYPATIVNIGTVALGRMEPKISFGSRADSFYEYMLKIWLQGNRKEDMYREMYDKSIEGMHRLLLKQDQHSGLWYIGQTTKKIFSKSMDHLVCFMGGLLALGAYTDPNGLQSERAQRDLKTAKAFTYSCYQMYAATATGLSPEIVESWYKNPRPDRGSSHYILRPEAVESFFILYQLTGDPVYREWGWEVFQAIEKYCKTAIAYASHPDVTDVNAQLNDSMESFFLGETLKYLYLLFDPDTEIDVLEKHIFNTEAHPLRIFNE